MKRDRRSSPTERNNHPLRAGGIVGVELRSQCGVNQRDFYSRLINDLIVPRSGDRTRL